MTATDLRVLLALGTCTNKHGWSRDTKQQRFADRAQLTRETVNRCLKNLEELGWVQVYVSSDKGKRMQGFLSYRVVLDPPYGPDGEREPSPTFKRRGAVEPDRGKDEDEPESEPCSAAENDEELDSIEGGCEPPITGGGVSDGSQGGCDDSDHRGCDDSDHSRVDSSIDRSSMTTDARAAARGQRLHSIWFDPDIELATALQEDAAQRSVREELESLLARAEDPDPSRTAHAILEGVDVRAYSERRMVRWAMVTATPADRSALRERLRGLGGHLTEQPSGRRLQIIPESKWARLTDEATVEFGFPEGQAGLLFDQALECGRTKEDLAPCIDGFEVVEDPEFKFAVRSSNMSCKEVGFVFIGAIKALGWNPNIKPVKPARSLRTVAA
ncbi:hypothetical protein [Maricaulis maris]|uniref:hypothetical protein n=1 Tax=Maricaulis maris TaxID=74318 RepID=UPI003B8BF054